MIRRNIEERIRASLADTPVTLLNGARQTGKTTLAQKIASEHPDAQYLTLDDAGTLALASHDPQQFVRNLSSLAVIDEVQRAPALFRAIKLEVDRKRKPGRFLLTGSANVLMLPQLSESLAGRMEIIPLFPFSQDEIENRRAGLIDRLFMRQALKVFRIPAAGMDIPSRLIRGGFPEAVQRMDEARRAAWHGSYISTILQRDVRDLAGIEKITALPNLLTLLAARSAGLLNMADIARDAGLSHPTVIRYLTLLETLFLIHRLPPRSHNIGKRLVKAPKLHMCDTGLACHLLGADHKRLASDTTLSGHLVESFVVGELRKQASWANTTVTLCHYRTSSGTEVDLVLEDRQGRMVGIEIKSSSTVDARDFAHLKFLAESSRKNFLRGIVLYQGEQVLPLEDDLWAVPIPALWGGMDGGGMAG